MKKVARRGLTALLTAIFIISAAIVVADVEIFEGSAQYIANEFETQEIAQMRAQQKAERDAQKKAGVYLTRYSHSVNAKLTDDEISAVTNNIINVSDVEIKKEPFTVKGEIGIIYKVTLKATIDPDGIFDFIKRNDKEKVTIIRQNAEFQSAIQENDALNENLREKYNQTESRKEKARLRKQMDEADRNFLANLKLDEGNKLFYAENYEGAIKFYNEAIKLKPNYTYAYNNRGVAYKNLGNYNRAFKDYNKTIEIAPNYASVYNNRGIIYAELEDYERAFEDYSKAIALNPNYAEAYYNRGNNYQRLEKYDEALADYDKALEINPNLAEAYSNRGTAYHKFQNYRLAI